MNFYAFIRRNLKQTCYTSSIFFFSYVCIKKNKKKRKKQSVSSTDRTRFGVVSDLKVAGSATRAGSSIFGSENFSNGVGDRCGKWAGSGRLAPKWLYLGVRSRSQGCRVTLTAGATPVEGRRGFRWRVETALALATFSCSRVRDDRGDGVKHSTTPDGQGVTTRPSNP